MRFLRHSRCPVWSAISRRASEAGVLTHGPGDLSVVHAQAASLLMLLQSVWRTTEIPAELSQQGFSNSRTVYAGSRIQPIGHFYHEDVVRTSAEEMAEITPKAEISRIHFIRPILGPDQIEC